MSRRIVILMVFAAVLASSALFPEPVQAQITIDCDECKYTIYGLVFPIIDCRGCMPALEIGYTFCNDLGVPSWQCCHLGGEFCEEIFVTP